MQVMANDRMESRGKSRRMEMRWSCDRLVMKETASPPFSRLVLMELEVATSSAMDGGCDQSREAND